MRVLLESDCTALSFKIPIIIKSGGIKITELEAGTSFRLAEKSGRADFRAGGHSYLIGEFEIYPRFENDLLEYKKKSYRGIMRIIPRSGKLQLLNVLNLEDYLKGVIHSEMGVASRPEDFEALKAFAVCIRNFAYMKIQESRGDFDVYGDVRDQVYEGFDSERIYTNKAVTETSGLVLFYNGHPAQTFYSSCCGGHTENSDNVFSQKGIDYLQGLNDGAEPYCRVNPKFLWEEYYTPEDLLEYLNKSKYIEGKGYSVTAIEIRNRFPSGRVNELTISLSSKKKEEKIITLTGNSIRTIIRSNATKGILRSTMFSLKPEFSHGKLSGVVFSGKGNGHGVGFCQWGAIGQSKKGRSFESILDFYFPGTSLSKT
ncbi:MAG: SpoIID/LytB domain-containing protein [Methanococcaceae archaeon]